MVLEKLDRYVQNNETRPLSHTNIKINSKEFKDINIRPEPIKLPEESIGNVFFDISHTQFLFVSITSHKGIKRKNKQMGLHQTERLLNKKENHQQYEKANNSMGEDDCK